MRCPACHRRLAPDAACPVHGEGVPAVPAAELPPLPEVPGLRRVALLGTGGFSHVFAAFREEDGHEVALKMGLGPHHLRFSREATALRRIGPPTTPGLLQEGTAAGRPFLVLESLRGQTLAAWMAALPGSGAASVPQVRELLAGLCAALERVHAAGVAHRDLKPENIFLREGGTLSLLDFGLARLLDTPDEGEGEGAAALTGAGQRLGTPHYMAPEQCLDAREAGPSADIYALGILLFELLTGAPPFPGGPDTVRHGHVSLRPPNVSERAAVPPALDEVLRRCLAKAPAERFASAREVREAFEAACRSTQAVPQELPGTSTAEVGRAGLRLVALLGVHSDAPVDVLLQAVEPQGGALARICERGYVMVFPESPSAEASLRTAALAARRLVEEAEAAAVLHLAELAVHPGTLTPRVAGAALAAPEGWWPVETRPGEVRVTAEAAARLGAGATRPEPEGILWLVREHGVAPFTAEAPPLVGREALLEALFQESSRALEEGVPELCVLTGEVGHGKTRLLEALAERWEAHGRARVVRLRAPSLEELVPGTTLHSHGHTAVRAAAEELRQRAKDMPQLLLVDEAHLADPRSLDALELATLSGAQAPLWVCAAGRPVLLGQRPLLGERSARATRHVLPPLPPGASRALLLHLLRPVEFIPEPVLARLEHLAQGVPLSLVELTGELRAAGALRVSSGGGWYIAPDALLDVSVTPLFERLATRALAGLPEVHQVLARLCAVLGDEVSVGRVDAALRQLEAREAVARVASWDAGAGLARLARAGVLRPVAPGCFAFRHRMLREALEASTLPSTRRSLHAAALRSLTGDGPSERRQRAHHAAACGAHAEAATAFLALAEQARHAHLPVEAEQHYTRALALLGEEEPERRARALAGRGRIRLRLQRFHESLADLAAARSLAEALGDEALRVDLLLEEATVRDWMEDVAGSAERTREALERSEKLDDPRLSLRLTLARGRLHVRQGEWEAAARLLSSAVEGAVLAREHETQVVALSLLGSVLTFLDRVEEAGARFDEARIRCEEAGDALHLFATLTNRVLLWLRLGDVNRMEADLRRAIALARELGHAQAERYATFNLAEVLYMQGRLEEALPLARRAHELGVRFLRELPVPMEALLLARISAAMGDPAEAARQLRWIEAHCSPESLPPTAIMRQLVQLQVRQPEPGGRWRSELWRALVTEADGCASADEKAEILLRATQAAFEAGGAQEAEEWLARAGEAVEGAPLWRARLDALREVLGTGAGPGSSARRYNPAEA
jgi:tetratricopeptide (TPR) repeat protein